MNHSLERGACWLALGALVCFSWRRCADVHRQRLQDRPNAAPEPLQRWEDEGGQSQQYASGLTRRPSVDDSNPEASMS